MSSFSGLDKFPFTIRQLNPSTYLIRETDTYGEYPHIFAKTVFLAKESTRPALIVLSDTGCGSSARSNRNFPTIIRPEIKLGRHAMHDTDPIEVSYNLSRFLRATINPRGEVPYLVISTHCHYDHILGLTYLPPTTSGMTTVLCSSHKKSFIVPRSNLVKHSLCNEMHVYTPKYDVGIWAHDLHKVVYTYPNPLYGAEDLEINAGLTILHTPGHTPDSLTWYDRSERYIVVGDSLYERESSDTKEASEPPMPTIFNLSSDLLDWWDSLKKVIGFVRERNEEVEESTGSKIDEKVSEDQDDWVMVTATDKEDGVNSTTDAEPRACEGDSSTTTSAEHVGLATGRRKQKVRLGAGHVTADVDAEDCLVAMQDFMRRILRHEIPWCSLGKERGEEICLWDEALGAGDGKGRFSVRAPTRIIEEGRKAIPITEMW